MTIKTRLYLKIILLFSFVFLLFPSHATHILGNSTLIIEKSVSIESNFKADIEQTNNKSISKTRREYFDEANVFSYIKSLFQPYFHYSRMSYVAALLIFLLYLFYFRYIDIYEYEPWKYIIITFIAGIIFADLGIILYDFTAVVLGWYMNGDLINDLFYTVLVIGGIEEFVKIIPLLILLRYTKIVNEPVDYIVYAAVAALGFAFSENVMYFDQWGASIIFSRALTAVVLHTSLSSIVAYGLVLRNYRDKKTAPLKMYFVAMLLHGLYDLFLMNPFLKSYILIAYGILFMVIIVFNNIISNSLSNSPFYNKSIHFEIRKIQFLLIGGLIGIFIIQFIMLSVSESFETAKENVLSSAIMAVFLIPALVMGFGKIEIHPKRWKSLKIPLLFTKITIDEEEGYLIDCQLEIKPVTRNRIMLDYFPNTGHIYKQSADSKNRIWFYVRLERIGHNPDYNNKHIILRSKFGNKLINGKEGIGLAKVYLVKNKNNKARFMGWCMVKENA